MGAAPWGSNSSFPPLPQCWTCLSVPFLAAKFLLTPFSFQGCFHIGLVVGFLLCCHGNGACIHPWSCLYPWSYLHPRVLHPSLVLPASLPGSASSAVPRGTAEGGLVFSWSHSSASPGEANGAGGRLAPSRQFSPAALVSQWRCGCRALA